MKIFAYFLGICALSIWLYSVQVKEKKNILLFQALANLFYAFQYFLFGYISTGLMNMVSFSRCAIFSKNIEKGKEPNIYYLSFFLVVIIIIGIFYCRSFLDFIPILATILYTISAWVKNDNILRYTYILCACIFFFYNLQVHAYIPLIGNVFELISGSISIYRFNIKK